MQHLMTILLVAAFTPLSAQGVRVWTEGTYTDIPFSKIDSITVYADSMAVELAEARTFVAESARRIIAGATRNVSEAGAWQGIRFVQPCSEGVYEGGCWVRDYYYGCLTGAISPDDIRQVYGWYKSHVATTGTNAWQVPDVIFHDGRPLWVGDRPALDGNPFMVMLATLYYRLTGDEDFIRQEIPFLYALMRHAQKKDGLAYNSNNPNRVGFGFEDSVHMTGKLAYCSVLYYDAAMRAYEVCKELGMEDFPFDDIARKVKEAFLPTFWDGTCLHAATGLCSGQFDVLAAAYAVSCSLVDEEEKARDIVEAFWKYNDELQVNGFYKHVPEAWYHSAEQVWESANQSQWAHVDIYQWGGFWTIGTPHVLDAIAKVKGRQAIAPMVLNLSRYVRENGLFEECRNRDGSWRNALHYVQTVGAVDAVLRMWDGEEWIY